MCLGFGLNVAPLIIKAIVKMVLEQDELTMKATSAYEVKNKLDSFGLTKKDLKRLKDGTLVLGLEVSWQYNTL